MVVSTMQLPFCRSRERRPSSGGRGWAGGPDEGNAESSLPLQNPHLRLRRDLSRTRER